MSERETVIRVEDMSKKFARSLIRSMRYGVADITRDIIGLPQPAHLRPAEFWASKNLNFEIQRGESVGLLGANGSGKSTLLKMLNGLIVPDKGTIEIHGRVGALIEVGAGFHPQLTGRENLFINASILGLSRKETLNKFDSIVEFAELGEFIDTPVKFYSSGMYVRLGFAIAAHVNPDVLLVDEVLAVGDVAFRMKCFEYITRLREQGTTIVIVSHNITEIMRIAQRCIVLEKGSGIFDGPVQQAISQYEQSLSRKKEHVETSRDDIQLGRVTTRNAKGNICTEFTTGDDVFIHIPFRSEGNLEEARVIVSFDCARANALSSVSSYYKGFDLSIRPPGEEVVFVLRKIPFLLGSYQITVNLYGPRPKDFVLRHSPASSFCITAPALDSGGYGIHGILDLQHEWERRPLNEVSFQDTRKDE